MKMLVAGLLAYCVVATLIICQPQIDKASDRICVPLYDETGLECCQ